MKTRLISLLLSVLLASSLFPLSASASHYRDLPHPDVAYEEMDAAPIDLAAAEGLCRRFRQDPAAHYEELLALYDDCYTREQLSSIRSDADAGNAALSAACREESARFDQASDLIYLALRDALASPKGKELEALLPEGAAEWMRDYESAPADSLSEETALIRDYYLLPDGEDFADRAGEIYLRLIALRRKEAENEGFRRFSDYAYAALYAREYVPEDMERLSRVVKSELAPLYVKICQALGSFPWDDEDLPSGGEVLDMLAAHMGDVSPELEEAVEHLRRNGLYRIGRDENMADVGYTVSLPAYRSAFLFNRVEGRFEALQTTVHELGHFNAAYHDPTPMFYRYNNIDVSELQAQGLEMLFIPCLQDILAGADEAGRSVVALAMLQNMLESIVEGCLYDELERFAYEEPNVTAEALRRREQELYRDYGMDAVYEVEDYWTTVTHLFDLPFYYASYAASALPALDLWLLSLRDREEAVERYLSISALGSDVWFLDVLEDHGLCDVTRRGDVVRLAQALQPEAEALLGQFPAGPSPAPLVVPALAALAGGGYLLYRRKKPA